MPICSSNLSESLDREPRVYLCWSGGISPHLQESRCRRFCRNPTPARYKPVQSFQYGAIPTATVTNTVANTACELDATSGITADILDHGLADDLAAAALSVARRFHAGATMWCIAPQWEPHAHHIAVEFVHPVIVGKRALPALALTAHDVVAEARVSVRPGDIVIAVAAATEPGVRDLMRRTPAWGALSLWIGSGERPPGGAADHVLWIEDANPLAPATGRFVLLYHLLWELTHVCFEHPGLLTADPAECNDEICVTCSDEGRPAEVLAAPGGGVRGACAWSVPPPVRRRSTPRWSGQSCPVISCWCTPARRSPRCQPNQVQRDDRGEHRIPLPVHRRRGA